MQNKAMIKTLSTFFVAGFFAISSTSQASEVTRQCGPGSMGFIKTGGQAKCLREGKASNSEKPPMERTAPAEQTAQGGASANVDQNLNQADLEFRDGNTKSACRWVSNAISSSTDYKGKNIASERQKQQLRQYARRCNLRY